jgi:hypothetical protein
MRDTNMTKSKGSVEHVSTSLQLDERIKMQENGWKAQAAGLVFILGLVLAAAIGLFGNGLVSKKRLAKNAAEIEYQTFYRFEARMELKIKTRNATDGILISFPNSYLQHFEIESILPEPSSTKFHNDKLLYFFDGEDNINVTYYLIPRKVGSVEGSIQVGENQFPLNHFIFP